MYKTLNKNFNTVLNDKSKYLDNLKIKMYCNNNYK